MKETYQIGPGRTVTVTIEASDAPDAGERLYTAQEVRDLLSREAERVAAPLRRELDERERAWAGREARVRELERLLASVKRERDERERAWAGREARVRELERLLAHNVARGDALEIRVSELIGELAEAESRAMANAIRNVRKVVGSSTPPATPAGPEVQA